MKAPLGVLILLVSTVALFSTVSVVTSWYAYPILGLSTAGLAAGSLLVGVSKDGRPA